MNSDERDGWKHWRDQLANACANSADMDQLARRLLSLELALAREKALHEARNAEWADAESWAIVGVAADGLLHELGNLLHRCVLQAAILERRAPEELRGDIQILRTEGAAAARLLAPLQRRREERRQQQDSANLNDCLRAALEDVRPVTEPRVTLGPDLPAIGCATFDLRRLVRLLLTTLLETNVAPNSQVNLCTQRTPSGQAELLAQFASPPWRAEVLEEPLDAPDGPFGSPTALNVLALRRLIRSTGAVLVLSNQPAMASLAITWS